MTPPAALAIAAICSLCCAGCLLRVGAAPATDDTGKSQVLGTDSTEDAAVDFLHKTFYSNAAFTDIGEPVRALVMNEIKRIGFNFAAIANRTLEDWQYIVRALFTNYYLKQKSVSERVTNPLYESLSSRALLGIRERDEPRISTKERADILSRIPADVINRVDKWNERPMERKFEDVVFIGGPRRGSQTVWSFTLEKPMATKKILNLKLGIHLTPESRERATGLTFNVRNADGLGSVNAESLKRMSVAGSVTIDPLSVSLSEEIQVDVTWMIRPRIYGMRNKSGGTRLELFFVVECPLCGDRGLDVTYMLMDCKVRVDGDAPPSGEGLLRRETREAKRLQRPLPLNTTAAKMFKNQQPGARLNKTQLCITEKVNRLNESCCMMEFYFNPSRLTSSVVLSPNQLLVSYCAGECGWNSQTWTQHDLLMQIATRVAEAREIMKPCCVANTFRDLQMLVVTNSSVKIHVLKDISAWSCKCSI